jgi:signal transduction histidine kinase
VAVVTGWLAGNERRERTRYQKAASELEKSYQQLQEQSEQLREIEEQLRHAERLSVMGELAASFAHEVRNPLGSIRGAVEILEDEISGDSLNREFVEVLKKEVGRLNQTIDNYLSLARRVPDTVTTFDFAAAVHSGIGILAATARKQKIHFRFELPNGAITVRADEAKFRQVVLNLLLNALAASPAGSEIMLRADLQKVSGLLNFLIEDHGSGMTPEVLQKAMQPFFTTKANGTGLGLPISKRIIEQFGWMIWRNRPLSWRCASTMATERKRQNFSAYRDTFCFTASRSWALRFSRMLKNSTIVIARRFLPKQSYGRSLLIFKDCFAEKRSQ